MKELIIATRGSKLALWQSEHIKSSLEDKYPYLCVKLKVMKTKGDKILDTPLAKIGGKGLFTKELEDAMLNGKAHIAVHSLKDVPVEFPKGLKLGVITKREDVRDAILSERYENIDALPKGAVVGTTSLRRRMQLLKNRPDLIVKNLRGNVNTRIQKLKNGEYDAILLATAGIKRLELQKEVNCFSPIGLDYMIPAMGQAALGIEIVDDVKIEEIVSFLNDKKSVIETRVERDFIAKLNGGCQVPIGINAVLDKDSIFVSAIVGLPDGTNCLHIEHKDSVENYEGIGSKLADIFIEKGAKEILKAAEAMAMSTIFS
ncbi:MAG: hydroxymethylbilane synthase [Campylobacteraceae bacterium]|jgi:hydroxymethylbilane synthase|nr:hydroxymethylbilane synthase [Campylobacteraceae bacterium]